MKDALLKLFSSAKFVTALIALLSVVAARYGFNVSQEMAGMIAAIFVVLLGAQGAADHGKEAAKESAKAPAVPTTQVAQGDLVNVQAPSQPPVAGEIGP